jgi:hypothetical protein
VSVQIVCNGCDEVLQASEALASPANKVAITGERSNGMHGGGLPSGRFDWCVRCARIAFLAVEDAKLRRVGLKNGRE